MQKINVNIICPYPFPNGMAATNRIISYSKGLVEFGFNVEIIIYIPSNTYLHDKNEGQIDNIKYIYPGGNKKYKNKFFHLIKILCSIFYSIKYLINKAHKNKRNNIVLISTDNVFMLFIFGVFFKLFKLCSFFAFDEYPIPIRKYLKSNIPFSKFICYKFILRMYNAYISMTESLSSFYNNLASKRTFILPTITDISPYKNIPLKNENEKYICYMGNMELSKDNVDNIIKAYSIIADKYDNIFLHLYGTPSNENKKIINQLIKELSLENKITLKGYVKRKEVPDILMNAFILVSSQPNTKRAEGGFPTKLGEYLAAGKPTLITDVGEISKSVTHNQNIFLAKPDDYLDYSKKLEFIINNYNYANNIALEGQRFLFKNYSHIAIGTLLANFILNVLDIYYNKKDKSC